MSFGLIEPMHELLRATRRPATWRAQAREASAIALTAALWPFGLADRGISELGRVVSRRTSRADSTYEAPVLLIHGYGANKSNWLFLERHLRDAGFCRIHALDYNPLRADLPQLGAACADRAAETMDHFGVDRIHLVGHSLGGVVARWAVQLESLTQAVTRVTIGSPHQGSPAARAGYLAWTLRPFACARQLCPGSPVLRRLAAAPAPPATRFVAYYSNVDVLTPPRSAMITDPALRARNVLVKDEGHLSILLSRRLADALVAELVAVEQEWARPNAGAGEDAAA